ncbi:MAG: DUF4143 domain-containing protein, partial [Bacteroidales bacterium]|nr:DUF4143 domain-containing protein [Bacteroidales bacterium]
MYDVQTNLIETFRQDFSKYAARSDKRCLTSVLPIVSSRVGNQIKYTDLAEDFSNPTIKKAFELLETARLFKRVRSVTNPQVPLLSHSSDKKFKAIMLDIGLLSNLSGLSKSTDFFKL